MVVNRDPSKTIPLLWNNFDSGDIGACLSILKVSTLSVPVNVIVDFLQHYSRESIMDKMAEQLLNIMTTDNSK